MFKQLLPEHYNIFGSSILLAYQWLLLNDEGATNPRSLKKHGGRLIVAIKPKLVQLLNDPTL